MRKGRFILSLMLLILLVACKPVNDVVDVVDDDYVPNSIYDFGNDTVSSKEEVIEKVVFYEGKLSYFTGGELEYGSSAPKLVFLSELPVINYTREDFTLYDAEETPDEYYVDVDSMMNALMTISILKDYIAICDDFVEGEFCDVTNENNDSYRILMKTNGDKLYIESYYYSMFFPINYASVNAEILFFDLVDGKVYFEYVRDFDDNILDNLRESYYYDKFEEGIGTINAGVWGNGDTYYQQYNTDGSELIRFSNGAEGSHVAYMDSTKEIYYSISFNAMNELEQIFLQFYNGKNIDLTYMHNSFNNYESVRTIGWNLLETTGWDYVAFQDENNCTLYKNEMEILSEFSISMRFDYNQFLSAGISINQDLITADLIDLSQFGLLFEKVSLEDIENEIEFLENSYLSLKSTAGFSESPEDNQDELFSLFPFFADETIVAELSDLVTSGQ